MPRRRAAVLVLDGVGAGELPDAADYGDTGSDTLGNTARWAGGLTLPSFRALGLGNLHLIPGVEPVERPLASFGRMAEVSSGKDSTSGHWEMMGLPVEKAFPTFPGGFPEDTVKRYSELTGHAVLGNRAASGTEIIMELGPEQQRCAGLIVYTSADSVFQVAAHESQVPLDELYRCCLIAREELLVPPDLGVGRVIARPFAGEPGSYYRTAGRRDYSLPPPGRTLLDELADAGVPVTGVGKVDDLFAHRSIETVHVPGNLQGLDELERQLSTVERGLVFANLVDFDSRWGHRNDPAGFAAGLREVDSRLPSLLRLTGRGEPFVVTADHGNDPTTPSTDHSREYVPLLVYSPGTTGRDLGVRSTFSDVARSLAEYFSLPDVFPGRSFLGEAGLS
jgi:phosphopentomutase